MSNTFTIFVIPNLRNEGCSTLFGAKGRIWDSEGTQWTCLQNGYCAWPTTISNGRLVLLLPSVFPIHFLSLTDRSLSDKHLLLLTTILFSKYAIRVCLDPTGISRKDRKLEVDVLLGSTLLSYLLIFNAKNVK